MSCKKLWAAKRFSVYKAYGIDINLICPLETFLGFFFILTYLNTPLSKSKKIGMFF